MDSKHIENTEKKIPPNDLPQSIFDKIEPEAEGAEAEHSPSGLKNILEDESLVFHGIGTDVIRMVLILQNGILSPKTAGEKGLSVLRNYDQGYNQDNEISVAQSPKMTKRLSVKMGSYLWSSFNQYIKPGISFAIKDLSGYPARLTNRDSGFADEAYIYGQVPLDNLTAVMVSPELLDTTVSHLPIKLGFDKYGDFNRQAATANRRVRFISDFLRDECAFYIPDDQIQPILVSLSKIISDTYKPNGGTSNLGLNREIADMVEIKYKELQTSLQGLIAEGFSTKLGIQNPTLRDILKQYKPSTIGLFDNNGNSLQL